MTNFFIDEERKKDITIGDSVRVLWCRYRKGWAKHGGQIMKKREDAERYADKVLEFLRRK